MLLEAPVGDRNKWRTQYRITQEQMDLLVKYYNVL